MDTGFVVSVDTGGVVVVEAVGDHDGTTAPEFVSHLAGAPGGTVILDLTRTTFMDSSILRSIVAADADASDRGAQLRVVAPLDSLAWHTLELVKLGELVTVVETLDEARRTTRRLS